MDYQEKFDAYQKLKGVQHLDADKALLEKKKPTSKALRNISNPDKETVQRDILWDLLDAAHLAEIMENRGETPVKKEKTQKKTTEVKKEETAPKNKTGAQKKKSTGKAPKRAGVPKNKVGGSAGSEDPKSPDSLQRPGEQLQKDGPARPGAGGESNGEEDRAAGGAQDS